MRHLRLHLGQRLRRLLAVLLLSSGLVLEAAGCNAPPVSSPFVPIPPPDPTFGPPTAELDTAGVSHTYWAVTSPPEQRLSNIWVYIDNSNLGVGASLRASADGSYKTRIEGQEGDRILFGFGGAYVDAELRLCRMLREGLANTACH